MENNENDDVISLKKNLLVKENEWKKDKALYEQKIQLLEMQLEDYKLREINQKKLNDTITQVIDIQGKTQSKSYSEFQKSIEANLGNNKKYTDQISKLEQQLRSANEQISEKENQYKDLEITLQKQQITYEHKIQNLEQDKLQLSSEIQKLKDQLLKQEDNYKSKEQVFKLQCEQEIQKAKDISFKDMQDKQQDYDQRYQQLAQLYEKEKEQLQQRLTKSQNTIKKYQTHIESNQETQQLQQKYEEQIAQLKQEIHEQQVQFQYEKKMLNKQIEEQQRNNTNNYDSTSKKKSLDLVKIRNSVVSQDSPVQCKSFHISQPDFKQALLQPKVSIGSLPKSSSQQQQLKLQNQSFERIKANNHDTLPMPLEDFNVMKSKKVKSQSINSIQTNNLASYLQEASIMKDEQDTDEFSKFKISNQQTTRLTSEIEQRRSFSQQGTKQNSVSSVQNLSKMLGQTTDQSYQKQTTSVSTQQKTHNNTSFSHFKVPAFSQSQLNNLKYSFYQQPCTTLRMNENHLNHIQSIKSRYVNQDESTQNDTTNTRYNKENQQPSKSVHINNEIKFLIGKLLQAKGRLTTELENTQKSCRYKN